MTEPLPPLPRRASARRIAVRRAVALVALLVFFGVLGWAALSLAGSGSEAKEPKVTALPPPPKPLRIVFPEGFTRRDMARRVAAVRQIAQRKRKITPRLEAKRYLVATRATALPKQFGAEDGQRSFEGFLFPATYEFTKRTTAKQLVEKQLTAFRRSWKKLNLRYAKSKNLTPYDVLIIASMVERETRAPEERQLVAAVIYNRLHQAMPLQIDATTRYGLNVPATEPLRQSQLESDSPYNTRVHAGLPPTPISNPGLASMQAAAAPSRKNYLYFVRKPDKVHHFFTSSFSEFQQKSAEYGYTP